MYRYNNHIIITLHTNDAIIKKYILIERKKKMIKINTSILYSKNKIPRKEKIFFYFFNKIKTENKKSIRSTCYNGYYNLL